MSEVVLLTAAFTLIMALTGASYMYEGFSYYSYSHYKREELPNRIRHKKLKYVFFGSTLMFLSMIIPAVVIAKYSEEPIIQHQEKP